MAAKQLAAGRVTGRVAMRCWEVGSRSPGLRGEPAGLVLDLHCDLGEGLRVLPVVMGAEQQLADPGSSTRTYAGAPHRSHRSRAVSGLVGAIARGHVASSPRRCRTGGTLRLGPCQPVISIRITTLQAVVCHPLRPPSMPRANMRRAARRTATGGVARGRAACPLGTGYVARRGGTGHWAAASYAAHQAVWPAGQPGTCPSQPYAQGAVVTAVSAEPVSTAASTARPSGPADARRAASHATATPRAICWSWRAWRPFASAPACTSARPTAAG